MKSKSIVVFAFAVCVVAVSGCGNQPGAAASDVYTSDGCPTGLVSVVGAPWCCPPGSWGATNDSSVCCPAELRYYVDGHCRAEMGNGCVSGYAPAINDGTVCCPIGSPWWISTIEMCGDPTLDTDCDGWYDVAEYQSGTDPDNPLDPPFCPNASDAARVCRCIVGCPAGIGGCE